MSIVARNIVVEGPDVMSHLAATSFDYFPGGFEAAPIYLTLDAAVTMTGSFSVGSIDYDYSGSPTISQMTRVAARDLTITLELENAEIARTTNPSAFADAASSTGLSTNEFTATLLDLDICANGVTPPFSPPWFGEKNPGMSGSVTGTKTDNTQIPAVVTDANAGLRVFPPKFSGTIADGDLQMYVELSYVVDGVGSGIFRKNYDASAWGSPDFRDIRGTYGATDTDSNGIEYVWSVTVG